jgi:uncharacterized protein YnzC (UPF0291/DUF896 family)
MNIDRINELFHKSRTPEGLSEEEKQEQAVLRREYIDAFKRDLASQLDSLVIVDECGGKRKLEKKEKK